jgi:hypothetical protein
MALPNGSSAAASGGGPSLVSATKLHTAEDDEQLAVVGAAGKAARGRMAAQRPEGWVLRLSPDAGEAGGSFHFLRPRRRGLRVPPGEAADPDRSAAEAARRARGKVRRYGAAHRLNRLGTLTYAGAGCFDIDAHLANIERFWRRMRQALGVDALAYVRVWEWHPKGHGLHDHFTVNRFVSQSLIRDAWGLGIVHITLIGDLPIGSTTRQEARVAARYLAPYLSKGGGDRPMGRHRYELAQGFPIAHENIQGRSASEVLDLACERMGGVPERTWHSDETPGWPGPPAVWAAWP